MIKNFFKRKALAVLILIILFICLKVWSPEFLNNNVIPAFTTFFKILFGVA